MKNLICIVAGDPESINTELIIKAWKKKTEFKVIKYDENESENNEERFFNNK